MDTERAAEDLRGGVKYATSFRRKFLGVNSDVEVVVDVATLDAVSTIAMRQLLSSHPAFVITLDNLRRLAGSLKALKDATPLLESPLPDAVDHQLNANIGGATAIVFRPPGKPARYALSIGLFNREGELSELDMKEIDESINGIEALVSATVQKVSNGRPRNT